MLKKFTNQLRQDLNVIIFWTVFIILPSELAVCKNCSNTRHKIPMTVAFFITARPVFEKPLHLLDMNNIGRLIFLNFFYHLFSEARIADYDVDMQFNALIIHEHAPSAKHQWRQFLKC